MNILLGITGGIAAYKAAELTSQLVKLGHEVEIIMTKNATEFIQPLTFESLTKKRVYLDTFERFENGEVMHIELAKKADIVVIAPATANIIAKIANGIADDMLTSTFLAATCPKMICPAMNTNMYENPITQANIKRCQDYGMNIVEPASGRLACGDLGKGKFPDTSIILDGMWNAHATYKPLLGKKILITAGPTQESIDPVRFMTNHSSGKMGYEIAKMARLLGGEVTLLSGEVNLEAPIGINTLYFKSAQELFELVKESFESFDYIIKTAAVGDYRVETIHDQKIKKSEDTLTLTFVKNPDILSYIGEHKLPHQIICGFAMETENLIKNATDKLHKKHCDLLVANHLFTAGAGFKGDTNVATLISHYETKEYPLMNKSNLAKIILEKMIKIEEEKSC